MSESEEMYLITIAHLKEEGLEGPVPVSRLAEDLSVVPVSANQMVKKLEASGMVRYRPYKGVYLTPRGAEAAFRVLRHRRLWKTFLVDHLGLELQEAEALACRLEHITADPIADRLSTYLGDPEYTPDGRPIPKKSGETVSHHRVPLDSLEVGRKGVVDFIETAGDIRDFLKSQGIHRGIEIRVLARGNSGSMLIEAQGDQVSLAAEITKHIQVQNPMTETIAAVGPGSG